MAAGSQEFVVKLLADVSHFAKGLDQAGASTSKLDRAMSKIGPAIKGAMVLGGAAIGTAAAFAVKSFNDIDEGLDAIRVGTGATGKEYEKLGAIFHSVNRRVVSSEQDVGQAIADVSTKMGLASDELDHMAQQQLELARITKTDLAANINETARVMGDWGDVIRFNVNPALNDETEALDFLFRVSQKFGPTVAELSSLMVQFGAPLRQLGFGFEESATLLGKFQQEGVNTELVMGALRIALGRLAKEGIDAAEMPKVFRERLDEIKTSADPVTKAMELFGAKAGPDMAAAIKEGRFELGNMVNDLVAGQETILAAAKATEDFGEKWTRISKGLKADAAAFITPALEELSQRLGVVGDAETDVEARTRQMTEAGEGFRDFIIGGSGGQMGLLDVLASFVDVIQSVAAAMGELSVTIEPAIGRWIAAWEWAGARIMDWLLRLRDMLNFIVDRINTLAAAVNKIIPALNKLPGVDIDKIPSIPHFAHGGPLAAGQLALVGERGPELFVPDVGGRVIPNDRLHQGVNPRGTSLTVNLIVQGALVHQDDLPTFLRDAFRRFQRGGGDLRFA